ncbi:hypothetical protein [Ideonella livida]|uniref:Uncharacterized protein n=1 Tax=Ideonella livida TaxID=2707176 RepID=A0A7C9TK76_9BURK|nr:hypothetical protein [Ideonella livida]NDY90146.1 hypothetical protein [Ideonella livida]
MPTLTTTKPTTMTTTSAAVLAGLPMPLPELTAQELARLALHLPGSDNADRYRLHLVAQCLGEDPPDLRGAFDAAVAGVRHAFRPEFTEDRPESFLLAACAHLLALALDEAGPPEGGPLGAAVGVALGAASLQPLTGPTMP